MLSSMPTSCKERREISYRSEAIFFQEELEKGVIDENITFVSTKHRFPALHLSNNVLPTNVVWLVLCREPINQLLTLSQIRRNRCPKEEILCQFQHWTQPYHLN
uniref:Uncharacterized protein n=1 Tax=Proboscia inermis TaxID=420281 RepID=A0A7S0C507_9STRA|mmetsp:Transcript_2728/g.2749  ORF Transcript_2728/g.2749 Transcript_2728/m.2749 type:complete len:104 (+) Transcript_2728:206-517(+)